jgi:hypothetical protein
MNSIVDMFTPDGKVELKITDLKDLIRSDALSWAENKVMINGLKAGINAKDILTMIGENEEREEK